jgi:hypothetical protein
MISNGGGTVGQAILCLDVLSDSYHTTGHRTTVNSIKITNVGSQGIYSPVFFLSDRWQGAETIQGSLTQRVFILPAST